LSLRGAALWRRSNLLMAEIAAKQEIASGFALAMTLKVRL